jgi:tripartite-type tricarboxylate transporter receptor subunit TctC
MKRTRLSLLVGIFLAAWMALLPASAQTYPTKPIRLIVPFGPGGGTDTLSRLVAKKMEESIGQSFIIDNRPGANTIIGAEALTRAAPDGYTLMLTLDLTMTMNPSLYSRLPYHPDKDFAPIGTVARTPLIFITGGKQPYQTLQEFLTHARSSPGKITYGAGAISSHVIGEKLARDTKIEMVYANYKSGAQALLALLSGDIQFAIMDIATVTPYLKDGRVRGLAVSGDKRVPGLPQVPAIGEVGLAEMQYLSWWGMYAPAGTPKPIIERLSAELGKALTAPDLGARLADLSFEPAPSSPEALLRKQQTEGQTMAATIKAAKLSLD